MKMISLKCPDCGANIEIDSEKEFGFCSYCGTKMLINSEMNENEASVKIAEIKANAKLEKMKMKDEKSKQAFIYLGITSIVIIAIILLMLIIPH